MALLLSFQEWILEDQEVFAQKLKKAREVLSAGSTAAIMWNKPFKVHSAVYGEVSFLGACVECAAKSYGFAGVVWCGRVWCGRVWCGVVAAKSKASSWRFFANFMCSLRQRKSQMFGSWNTFFYTFCVQKCSYLKKKHLVLGKFRGFGLFQKIHFLCIKNP